MARLPYLTPEQLPESERGLFDEILERFGRVNNIFRVPITRTDSNAVFSSIGQ